MPQQKEKHDVERQGIRKSPICCHRVNPKTGILPKLLTIPISLDTKGEVGKP